MQQLLYLRPMVLTVVCLGVLPALYTVWKTGNPTYVPVLESSHKLDMPTVALGRRHNSIINDGSRSYQRASRIERSSFLPRTIS